MWIMYYEQKFKIMFLSTGNGKICVVDYMESIAYAHAARYFLKGVTSRKLRKCVHKEKSVGTVKIFGRESNM
jgi:hypothetical protein